MKSATSVGIPRAFYKCVQRHFLLALVLTFCMGPLQGATLERLSLDDMIAQSTAIVRGTVTSSYSAQAGTIIYTHYKIQVAERFKGSSQGSVDVVVPGGFLNNVRQSFAGAPTLNPGDDYVFFLWTSRAGLTQVIGLTQGLFSVRADGSADPVATRNASNELMLDHATGQPVKDLTLSMHLSDLRTRISAGLSGTSKSGSK